MKVPVPHIRRVGFIGAGVLTALGGLFTAISLSAAVGTASADSMFGPLINTPCSYAQIVSALQAEAPDLASLLNANPQAQTRLQQFLALPVDQRQQRVQQQMAANPQWQSLISSRMGTAQGQEVMKVANTCQNY